MCELDEHACRVGRIAIAAAQLEAEVAHVVHVGKTGAWDNNDDWLPHAANTGKLKLAFAKVAKTYPELLEAEVLVSQFENLLDRRNKLVHSVVRYSFFEYEDGSLQLRDNPFKPEALHPRTGRSEPLPAAADVDALEREMQEMAIILRRASGRVAAAFEQRANDED